MSDDPRTIWWPNDEQAAELERRARAALAEVGLDVPVTFEPSGFHWPNGFREHEPQIERACDLAWVSVHPRENGSMDRVDG